ncbi:Gfo/Idh/MocA family oxidoreductase [Salinibacterium sp. UTAS2018]|uniref:Gfo/Idh/MocA family protein n=1 Tax=Salinibacterium sp. UTAS2018 TaxID=2508880 RepID=UPI00100954E0|nr:Gfo/Idh/MocA family oxidoreductase [Salinibacterium sp. UTAS2018]QAV70089.1 Gfo/Idh/MocA family oxidoreductase [Salinibacterium sp. UTAS2018]
MSSRLGTGAPVRLGIVGAGFVADFYLRALGSIRGHDVTVVAARSAESGAAFAERFGIPVVVSTVAELVERDDVDIVIVALPQDQHVAVVAAAAAAGKGIICTKPLGRNSAEAAECLRLVREAGVWHAYAETEVFAPGLVKAKELVDAGAVGRVTSVRARESHGHPHKHARDVSRSGGGPLRALGCHCVAIGRWFIGYDTVPKEVFAWGARLSRDDVETEDTAVALIRFEDDRMAQVEVSWGHIAGLDVRNEIHGTAGWIGTDETGETGIRAFAGNPADYVVEKAGAATGWITPVPDEPWVYGYHGELTHFVECYRAGVEPRQTFVDGYIDNAIIDAAYRSMESGTWVPIDMSAV